MFNFKCAQKKNQSKDWLGHVAHQGNDFKFLHVCAQNTYNSDYKIWEMIEKIKSDVNRRRLV